MKKNLLLTLFTLHFSLFTASANANQEQTLRAIYEVVVDNYAENITAESFAVFGLKKLSMIDRSLNIANETDRLSLYYNGRVVKNYAKPGKNSISPWAAVSDGVLTDAAKLSPKIAEQSSNLVDTLMLEVFKEFKDGSKYYTHPDDLSKKTPNNYIKNTYINGILYIRLPEINEQSASELASVLEQRQERAKGLILDLRGNTGGSLKEAVAIGNIFLDEGILVSIKGKKKSAADFFMAKKGDKLEGKPLVILMNGNTASASEVIASSLSEQGRAKLVGSRTFGKGSIQSVVRLPNDSLVAITSGYFYTPGGKAIDKEGILPDVCTVDLPSYKDIANLLERSQDPKVNDCQRETRSIKDFDIKVASEIINTDWHKIY